MILCDIRSKQVLNAGWGQDNSLMCDFIFNSNYNSQEDHTSSHDAHLPTGDRQAELQH